MTSVAFRFQQLDELGLASRQLVSRYPDTAVQEFPVRTKSGTLLYLDGVAKDIDYNAIVIQEYKASQNARLTPNQKTGFPELEITGATVVGQGKVGFQPGIYIPASTVTIKRSQDEK